MQEMHEGICQNYERCDEIVLSLTIRGIEFEDSVTKKKKILLGESFRNKLSSKLKVPNTNIKH